MNVAQIPNQPQVQGPRNALVTGGAGFIGARLVEQLADRGWRVTVVDDLSSGRRERVDARAHFVSADIAGRGALTEVLHDCVRRDGSLHAIVHLAARVGVRRVLADPEACRTSNRACAHELVAALDSLDSNSRPAFFAASTSEVYAEKRGPLREDDPLRSTAGQGRWAYAGSKLEAEHILDEASARWAPESRPLHLRFFNVVGPGQDADSGMVLPRFVEQATAGRALTVHGDGTQVRTFAHVDDICSGLLQLLERDAQLGHGRSVQPTGPLNLGGTARSSILELALLVLHLQENASGIEHVDPRRSLSRRFEEVLYREPCLARAHSFGLPACDRDLESIVRDTLARHAHSPQAAALLGSSPDLATR